MKYKKKFLGIVIVLFVSMLPLVSLFQKGVPVAHDWPDHVARIANFYASLSEGNIVPRWAMNLNWEYGHPILMFLYPFPSYVASLFRWIGFSFIDSTKLVFALTYILSAIAMHLWVRTAFGKKEAIIAGLLYGFAPYRFVDLFVRGALGEHAAFIFPPLICYFLFRIFSDARNVRMVIGLSVSIGLLILTHNAVALMFIPVFFLYALYVFVHSRQKAKGVFSAVIAVLLGLGVSSFFWIPAFFEGKYTLRDIVTAGEAMGRFVPWSMFLYSPFTYGGGETLSKFLGFAQWIGIIFSIYLVIHKKTGHRVLLISLCFLLFFTLFVMTGHSLWLWEHVTILQKFQFPWRFMSVAVFLTAVAGSISISESIHLVGKKTARNALFVIFCVLIVMPTIFMWKPKAFTDTHESHFTGVYLSTTDTGESSPIWSVRFMEHTPPSHAQVVSGDATIREVSRKSTIHEYRIHASSPSRIVEHTLYFPGWNIYVNGMKTGIQFQDPDYRGLMTYRITEGDHDIRVVFEDTKLRYVSNIISLGTIVLMALLFISTHLWQKKH